MRLSLTHGSSVTRQAFIDVHIDSKGTFEMHSTNFAFVLVNSVENIPTSFGTLIAMIMGCKISSY